MGLPGLTTLSKGLRAPVIRFPAPGLFSAAVTVPPVSFLRSDFHADSALLPFVFPGAPGFVLSPLVDLSVFPTPPEIA